MSEDGREICISVIRDISAEVEARERLEKQAARYDHLFQSVLTGIVQYSLTGCGVAFKNANQEAIRIFGYTPDEFWTKQDWDLPSLIAEEDRARVLAEIGRLRRPGDINPFEYRMIRKDGSLCWIIGRAEVILDLDGELVIQSVFMDINERKWWSSAASGWPSRWRPAMRFCTLRWNTRLPASFTMIPQVESARCRSAPAKFMTAGAFTGICREALRGSRWRINSTPLSMRCMSVSIGGSTPQPVSLKGKMGISGAVRRSR